MKKHTPSLAPEPASRGLRLMRAAAWFVLIALVFLFISVSVQRICNPDLWWQLRTGQIVLQQGFPTTDLLSYTAVGHEWIEMRWIFCILAYWTWLVGGTTGIIFAHAALCAVIFFIFCWRSRATLFTLPGLITLALGLAVAQNRFTIRPEIMTYLFSGLALVILEGAIRPGATPRDRKMLWLLPVLQVIWTNSHTVFIFGPLFAFAFAGGDFGHRVLRRMGLAKHTANPHQPHALVDWTLIYVALAITAACWINPYFHRGAMFPFLLFGQTMSKDIAPLIQELVAPMNIEIWGPDLYLAIVLICWTAAVLTLGLLRFNVIRVGLWLPMVYLYFKAVRNIGPLAFISLWACLRTLDDLQGVPVLERLRATITRSALKRGVVVALTLALGGGVLFSAWYVATNRLARAGRSPRQFGLGVIPWVVATDAVAWMREHKPQGPILNSIDDGAYISFFAPQYKVWVDGRLEVYGNKIFELIGTMDMALHWQEFTEKHGFNTIILHRDQLYTLFDAILGDPRWVLVHMDSRTLVFVKNIPEHASIIASQRIDPYAPWVQRGPAPDQQPPEWARRLGAVGFSWHWLGMALDFLRLRSLDNCQMMLERAHAEFPGDRQATLLLAQLYRVRNRAVEAEALEAPLRDSLHPLERTWMGNMRAAMAEIDAAAKSTGTTGAAPPNAMSLTARADEAKKRKDWPVVVENYRKVVEIAPTNWGAWENLAYALVQTGDTRGGAEAYRMVTRLQPGRADAYANLGHCLYELADYAGSKAAFEEAVRLKPANQDALQMVEQLKTLVPAPAPSPAPNP